MNDNTKTSKRTIIIAVLIITLGGGWTVVLSMWQLTHQTRDWSHAFKDVSPISAKVVSVRPTDGSDVLWNQRSGEYDSVDLDTANGHWLAKQSINVPINRPARLWYDGKLTATHGNITSIKLSANGLHHAYTAMDTSLFEGMARIYKDGREIATGYNARVLGISNDGGHLFYATEYRDGRTAALNRDDQIVAQIKGVSVWNSYLFQVTPDGEQFAVKTSLDTLLVKGKTVTLKDSVDEVYLSPNLEHILHMRSQPTFPVGDVAIVFVDGKDIFKGDPYVAGLNDDGEASYNIWSGSGGGNLVIRGKKYSFKDGSRLGRLYVSPSGRHAATIVDRAVYLDGEMLSDEFKVDAYDGDDYRPWLELDDDVFYLYK